MENKYNYKLTYNQFIIGFKGAAKPDNILLTMC